MSDYIPQDHLEYPSLTLYQMVERMAKKYPKAPACEFNGSRTGYEEFVGKIDRAARALQQYGVKKGDAVTLCMPNIPQALVAFYAVNRIGAIANMVHPLSAREEICFYLTVANSGLIVAPDLFYEKIREAADRVDHPVIIIAVRIQEALNPLLKLGYQLKTGRNFMKFPNRRGDMVWSDFMKRGDRDTALPPHDFDKNRTSVILYSGGTSGKPKGICLSDYNLNACSLQARERTGYDFHPGIKMLSCMPMFHGFGLGINIHLILIHGACCILMPSFTKESYAKMLVKKKPNFIAGVPTIFEALLHLPELEKVDLNFLMGMYCGGDSLSVELKKKIDTFLKEHHASIQVREGYGLTECVTASCLTPLDTYKPGSIGVPFPDTTYAIVEPDTDEILPSGKVGEIILTGPSLMIGYLNAPEENAKTLRKLADGRTWLYTGDMGHMDEEGYVYFSHRRKRMIITNGYNVYPGQLENVIDSCPEVAYSCVIGVKDPRRMQRVRAYVVLRDGSLGDEAIRQKIMGRLKENIAAYALPREMIFRRELPKTLVGKVAFRALEEEANKEEEALAPQTEKTGKGNAR